MRVILTSAFRDAPDEQIQRWCRQVREMCTQFFEFEAFAIEGDSTDNTAERLAQCVAYSDIPVTIIHQNLGTPRFGSVESPERFLALTRVLNRCQDAAQLSDIWIHVESDLVWRASTMLQLIHTVLLDSRIDVLAPMVFAGDLFYDVWAFRKDGVRFSPFPPFIQNLTEVDSAGSCLVIRGSVANSVRVDDGALVGWCDEARRQGFRIFVDPKSSVRHP